MHVHGYFQQNGQVVKNEEKRWCSDKQFVDERWIWDVKGKTKYEEDGQPGIRKFLDTNRKCISTIIFKWFDLFGKEPEKQFIFTSPNPISHIVVLSRRFVLFQIRRKDSDPDVQVGEFDWDTDECFIGETVPFASLDGDKILLDRSCQNDNPHFLYYHQERNESLDFWHYRINFELRRVEKIGTSFQHPREMFTFIDFHDGILRGLSSKKLIRFNVQTQKMLESIAVNGLPSSFFNGSRRNTIAWTDDNLYASVTSREDGKGFHANIYILNLKTGEATFLLRALNGHVRKMLIGTDQRLYMCVRNKFEDGNDNLDKYEASNYPSRFSHLQFCRISLNKPESLFLLAFTALPRPIPWTAHELIRKRKDTPMNLYKVICN